MGTLNGLCLMLFQGGDTGATDHSSLLVWAVVVIAFCSFVQFLVFVGAAIAGLKVYKEVKSELAIVKQKAFPIVASVQGVVDDLRPRVSAITAKVQEIVEDSTPKVKTVTANVADMSTVAKNKVRDFESTLDKANQTVRDANDRTRAQVDKVDGMVSSTLKATSDLGTTIHRGIRVPVLEVAGVVKGVKAALDVLLGKAGFGSESSWSAPKSTGRPGPIPVPTSSVYTGSAEGFARESGGMDPSSSVPPSPGAAEVVERFRREQASKL